LVMIINYKHMKRIPCKELSEPNGPPSTCTHVFEVNSFDDLITQATEHVKNTPHHTEDAKKMETATDQETEQWMTMARRVYESKPEE